MAISTSPGGKSFRVLNLTLHVHDICPGFSAVTNSAGRLVGSLVGRMYVGSWSLLELAGALNMTRCSINRPQTISSVMP